MRPQHLRDLLHRFDHGAHGSSAPGIIMERFFSRVCGCPWVWASLIVPMLLCGNDQSLSFDFVITSQCSHFKSITNLLYLIIYLIFIGIFI